jgi:hypothetical protein
MRVLIVTLALFSAFPGAAQKVVDITRADADVVGQERMAGLAGGQVFPQYKYIKIKEGSPYYLEDWSHGSLVMANGTAFHDLDLKLDLLNHEVHYKDAGGNEMVLTTPVREIIFFPGLDARIFIPGKPWSDVDKALEKAWLRVLVNDKTSLLLDIRKKLVESTSYASATAEEVINDEEVYFLQKDDHLFRVKHWSDLSTLLGDKQDQVAQFIKANHLTGDAPLEYAEVVAYYNRL